MECVEEGPHAVGVFRQERVAPDEAADRRPSTRALSPASRTVLWRISALFALDSFAGGFLGSALLAYFFHAHFTQVLNVLYGVDKLYLATDHPSFFKEYDA